MIGYYVMSFQKVPDRGLLKIPYEGKIIQETGTYWELQVGRLKVRVLKAACSSIPYKNHKEAQSTEYAQRVLGAALEEAKTPKTDPLKDLLNF